MEKCLIYHSGIKGMRWGERRYQNKDGTLTEAGKRRYARDAKEKGYKKQDEAGTYYKTNNKGKNREDLEVDAKRYFDEDLNRSRTLVNESASMTNKLKNVADKSIRDNPKGKMDLSSMTDQEMRNQINRALLEKQYNDMFAPQKSTKGKEFVSKALEVGGDVLAITGSALGIALSIRALRGGSGG